MKIRWPWQREKPPVVPDPPDGIVAFAKAKYAELGIADLWDKQEEEHFRTRQAEIAREALNVVTDGDARG